MCISDLLDTYKICLFIYFDISFLVLNVMLRTSCLKSKLQVYYFSVVAPSHRSDDDVDFAKPLSTKVPQAKRASSASSASSSVGARKSLLPTNRSSSGKCDWVEGVLEFNLLKIMIPFLNLLRVYMIFVSSVYSKCNYFYIKLLAL